MCSTGSYPQKTTLRPLEPTDLVLDRVVLHERAPRVVELRPSGTLKPLKPTYLVLDRVVLHELVPRVVEALLVDVVVHLQVHLTAHVHRIHA